MGRIIPITRDSHCLICGQPIHVVESAVGLAIFDPESENRPHACPLASLIRFARVWSTAHELIQKGRADREKTT